MSTNKIGRIDMVLLDHIQKSTAEYLEILQSYEQLQCLTIKEKVHFKNMVKACDVFGLYVTSIKES